MALVLSAGTATVLLVVPAATAIVSARYRVPAIPALCLALAISGSLLANRATPSALAGEGWGGGSASWRS